MMKKTKKVLGIIGGKDAAESNAKCSFATAKLPGLKLTGNLNRACLQAKVPLLMLILILMIGIIAIACDNGSTPTADPCASGHAFPSWITPTCEVAGNSERACTRSGCTVTDTRTEGFAKLDHDWEYDPDAVPPTCKTEGKGHRHCKKCPADEEGGTYPKLDHKWEWSVTEPPNCVFAGVKVRVCEDCETEETDVVGIEKDEHDIGGNNPPTCLLPGSGTIFCKRDNCEYTETAKNIEPRGHHFVEHWDEVTAATCIAQGLEERFCTHDFCDKIEDPNDAKNHYRQTQPIAINPKNHADGCDPSTNYIITGSGTAFSVTGKLCIPAAQPIQNTLTAIRAHADGAAVTIQFGNGTDLLEISTATASFNNTGGTWGLITLTGRIISSYDGNIGTIQLANNVSINSTAEIANTDFGRAIYNDGTGTVNILGGTIWVSYGTTVSNSSTGTITISGGTVWSGYDIGIQNISTGTVNITGGTIQGRVTGIGISNISTGTVNISGGTIQTENTTAIWNASTGTVTITGTNTVITSRNTSSNQGTVYNNAGGRIEISGGTISNTGNSVDANAICNSASGIITLRNCTVQSTTNGYAIRNLGLHNRINMDNSVETQGIRLLGSDHDSSVPAANCESPHICAINFCDYVIEPAGHKYGSLTLVNGDNITTLTGIAVTAGTCSVCSFNPGQTTLSLTEYIVAHSAEGTAADPVPLKVSIDLGTMGTADNGWTQLLTALNTGGKFVALDLSGSTRSSNGDFSTGSASNTVAPGLAGLKQIASIILPSTTITSIGNDAFRNCTNLTSVTIGNSVTSIGGSAFRGCSDLTSVTIPNSVTSISSSAFFNCTGLTSIIIPDSVTSIGSQAFWLCSSLTSVTIGNSVTSIGNNAFIGCTNLRSVTFERADTTFGNNNDDFPNGTSLYRAYITNSGGIGTYIRTGTTWAKEE